jgi:hypothetical protein
MRSLTPTLAPALLALALAACGGSSSNATPTTRTTQAAASPATAAGTTTPATGNASPVATASEPAPVTPGATVEVTGIVGTVSATTQTIEIRRLQGANVTRLEVGPRTSIRKAAGGTAQLRDIRPSDRLVAEGVLNDRGDTLLASQITVQDILPGAQPGG